MLGVQRQREREGLVNIYAVIPTHNRPAELVKLLDSIPPAVHVLVIDNASEPRISAPSGAGFQGDQFIKFLGRRIQVIRDEEQPPNLSRLWNIGLDWAERLDLNYSADHSCDPATCTETNFEYAVAILNDDVVLPPEFLSTLAQELISHDVDIAFPGPVGSECLVNRHKSPPGVDRRMTGWCFVVRGSSGLRADERLRWWCGDDDLELSALHHGRGTVRVGGTISHGLVHRYPDQSTTGVLREQTNRDMDTFVKKWGRRPW